MTSHAQARPSDIVDITGLDVRFATDSGEVHALKGIDLALRPGEILAVVGESGSGKSVTARTIMGLLPETATPRGAVVVAGHDLMALSPRDLRAYRGRDAAMVFQEPSTALNPVFTVGWQIAEGLRAHERLTSRQARARAVEALRQVGIPDPERRVDDYPHQFSGGQKQRVVIAAALALRPSVIVADEPTTALDVTVQAEILALLRRLRDETGTSILLITHNMGVVADLADRVVVMNRGAVVEEAPVRELFSAPREEYTRTLLAAVPRVGARSASAGAEKTRMHEGREVLVEARGLEVRYPGRLGRPGVPAVRGVDFTLHAGEVFGLVGESGSGKTTIGRALAGLTRATGGSLRVLGHEMVGFRERQFRALRKDIGFVFQDPAASFNPQMTVGECVAEPLSVHTSLSPSAVRARVGALLEQVQLPASAASRYPHELSGGQRQRVSLARGLALEPKLLVADEPTSALDVSVQAKVLELFREIQAERGFAALFISHDLAVVDELSHWVGVLLKGEMVEQGVCSRVLSAPSHDYTRRLLASLPVPDPDEQAIRRAAALKG